MAASFQRNSETMTTPDDNATAAPPQPPKPPSLSEALGPLLESIRGFTNAANAAPLHELIALWLRWTLYVVLLLPIILAIVTIAWADANALLSLIFDLADVSSVALAFLVLLLGPIFATPVMIGLAIINWLNEHARRQTSQN